VQRFGRFSQTSMHSTRCGARHFAPSSSCQVRTQAGTHNQRPCTHHAHIAVQRVPRYRLLLKELRKHTGDGHPDAGPLDAALGQVETAATHINEGIRRRENMEKILEIQEDEGVSIVSPGRVFLKEGSLNKLCRRGFKPFKFYLFNDCAYQPTYALHACLRGFVCIAHSRVPCCSVAVLWCKPVRAQ